MAEGTARKNVQRLFLFCSYPPSSSNSTISQHPPSLYRGSEGSRMPMLELLQLDHVTESPSPPWQEMTVLPSHVG